MAGVSSERLRATVDGSLAYELDQEDVAPGARKGSTASDEHRTRREEGRAAGVVLALPPSSEDRAAARRRYEVIVDGWRFEVAVEKALRAALRDRASRAGEAQRPASRQVVRAQIPGRIVTVFVAVGDRVTGGDRLLSVEAMKMENEVRAAAAGTIERVGVAPGDRVELGDELVVIE